MSPISRVAIASTDGKCINEHFGRAGEFLIVDIYPDSSWQFVEKRAVTPLCSSGEHTEEGLHLSVRALRDCRAVLVARIGFAAKRWLELNGISVFEQADYIDTSLALLAKYLIKTEHTS